MIYTTQTTTQNIQLNDIVKGQLPNIHANSHSQSLPEAIIGVHINLMFSYTYFTLNCIQMMIMNGNSMTEARFIQGGTKQRLKYGLMKQKILIQEHSKINDSFLTQEFVLFHRS